MTKKLSRIILVVFILTSFIIPSCLTATAADTTEISLEVKYGQTEARKMLDMINSFRTGSEAWYWNESNTEKIYKNGLSDLEYDYKLEEIAMQRAAEIAVSFSHTRPDGTSCFTAFSGSGNTSYGENIAMGYTTASAAFVAWREDNEKYSGQGHRRNMLNAGFTQVGIGHAYVNGRHYWVQEFGNKHSSAPATAANDGYKTVKINALSSLAGKFTTTTTKQTTTAKPSTTKRMTTTARATTTTTRPASTTVKHTTTTTVKHTTTVRPTTAKPPTAPTTTTTKPATTTTTTSNTTTKEIPTAKAELVTKIDSTTEVISTPKTDSTTDTTSVVKADPTAKATSAKNENATDDIQIAEPIAAEPQIIDPTATEAVTDDTNTEETAIEAKAIPSENCASSYTALATAAVLAAAGIFIFCFIRSRKK